MRLKLLLVFAILTLILALTLHNAETIDTCELEPINYEQEIEIIEEVKLKSEPILQSEKLIMKATAYDLSIQSCGKPYGHPARGITTSGRNLNNTTRHEMVVSSNDFPLGTKLKITFPEEYEHFNGIYTVEDTGNMKPGVLDIFVGDFGEEVSLKAIKFGKRTVEVEVISDE